MGETYILRVSSRIVHPVTPADETFGLLAEQMLVGCAVKLFDMFAAKYKSLDGPVTVLDLIDLGRDGSHNSKVVTGTLEGPPKIGILVDGLEGAIGQHDIHRDPLICNDAVMALEPTVSSSEARTHIANTLAGPSHY